MIIERVFEPDVEGSVFGGLGIDLEVKEGGHAEEEMTILGGGHFLDAKKGVEDGLREGSRLVEEAASGCIESETVRAG